MIESIHQNAYGLELCVVIFCVEVTNPWKSHIQQPLNYMQKQFTPLDLEQLVQIYQ